jgi:hypothetical protein
LQGQGFNRPNNGKMKVTCTKGLELNDTCDLHREKKKSVELNDKGDLSIERGTRRKMVFYD